MEQEKVQAASRSMQEENEQMLKVERATLRQFETDLFPTSLTLSKHMHASRSHIVETEFAPLRVLVHISIIFVKIPLKSFIRNWHHHFDEARQHHGRQCD